MNKNQLKKMLVAVGGIALALLLIPKAAHAVVATLVQVANTAAAPAVSEDVSNFAAQNIMLAIPAASDIVPFGSATLHQLSPSGVLAATPFVVPPGQSLVVTSIEITPANAGFEGFSILNSSTGNVRETLNATSPNTQSVQFQFPNGIVFAAGESVEIESSLLSTASFAPYVHGYLTSN